MNFNVILSDKKKHTHMTTKYIAEYFSLAWTFIPIKKGIVSVFLYSLFFCETLITGKSVCKLCKVCSIFKCILTNFYQCFHFSLDVILYMILS